MLEALENQIVGAMQGLFDQFGWVGVFGMMAFENATGITPSELILTLAGWMLVAAHDLHPVYIVYGGFISALGSTAGSSVTYWAVRLGGRPLVERAALWFRINPSQINRAEEQFQRWGTGLVLVGRVIPGVRTLVSIPAGLARMSFPLFLVSTLIGTFTWCTFLIAMGYMLGSEWMLIGGLLVNYLPYIILIASIVLILVLIVRWRLLPAMAIARKESE